MLKDVNIWKFELRIGPQVPQSDRTGEASPVRFCLGQPTSGPLD
jgi:hypothetical protein